MSDTHLPLLVEPADLRQHLGSDQVLIVDLSNAQVHQQYHVPGAVHLDYGHIIKNRPPVVGLVPEPAELAAMFTALGIRPDTRVVAYDEEGGGKAARFLWTLEVTGHPSGSLLNGGLQAWLNSDHPITNQARMIIPGDYTVQPHDQALADQDYVRSHLGRADVAIVDARSPAEYQGQDLRTRRGGHIPGAVNIEWTRVLDHRRNMRLKSEDELRQLFEAAGVIPDKQIITYCQSHHRSALVYFVLKYLGYPRVKGYPGSWSDWGNSPDTPIET